MYFLFKRIRVVAFLIVCLALSGCRPGAEEYIEGEPSAYISDGSEAELSPQDKGDSGETVQSEAVLSVVVIHICGAVNQPGVYELPAGSRVVDAVKAGGGLTDEADETRLNEAGLLTDGEQIVVPKIGEDMPVENGYVSADGGKVNINTADMGRLQTLSGIGEAKARAVIEDREKNGAFSTIEDIMRVSGIGEGVYNRIKDNITV